jgi:hypothetical protein
MIKLYESMAVLNGQKWNAATLVEASKDLEVKEVDPEVFDLSFDYWGIKDTTDFISHVQRLQECDTEHPIILSPRGEVMDGVHRICKAIIEGKKVKYVKFKSLPHPDGIETQKNDR